MCRLFALTSKDPVSPMLAIRALDVMKEGHDGSGVGLLLQDLGGAFEEMKDSPILSGIFTEEGIRRLDLFMMDKGFLTRYKISLKIPKKRVEGIPPGNGGREKRHDRLLLLAGRDHDQGNRRSHARWPNHLQLDRKELHARIIMAQGRQNTNYAINLYACHPFFIKGYSTMTNGENTAFIPIREYLKSRALPDTWATSPTPRCSPTSCITPCPSWGWASTAYKHVITPLQDGRH
jgi:hypothetical protein